MLPALLTGPSAHARRGRTNVNHHANQTEPGETSMNQPILNRRQFIGRAAALTSLAWLPTSWAAAAKRTAADQVTLGKTGIKLSRLGFGTGSNSGNVQYALGKETFTKLIHYAYDQGITYIDAAMSYRTHEWIGDAIKGLPLEKLYVQTKIGGVPEKPLEVIDKIRQTYNTDYVDTLLVHCTIKKNWDEERKRMMDAVSEAQSRKWVRARGVSCHSLPALSLASKLDWVEVNLVRVNPQGAWIDTPAEDWNAKSEASHLPPVVAELKTMKEKGHGVIGMKMIGNGDFTQAEDREKAIRYAMSLKEIDAVVVGFKSTAEIDEAIQRVNRALAEAA
jgi:predicted aldo/keto reductase-like oxidoreductase